MGRDPKTLGRRHFSPFRVSPAPVRSSGTGRRPGRERAHDGRGRARAVWTVREGAAMLEPAQDFSASSDDAHRDEDDTLLSRLFGVRRSDGVTVDGGRAAARRVEAPRAPAVPAERAMQVNRASRPGSDGDALREEIGDRVSSGFRDLSRLLVAIKETLQNRDGQVQQTLQALPGYLQQVPGSSGPRSSAWPRSASSSSTWAREPGTSSRGSRPFPTCFAASRSISRTRPGSSRTCRPARPRRSTCRVRPFARGSTRVASRRRRSCSWSAPSRVRRRTSSRPSRTRRTGRSTSSTAPSSRRTPSTARPRRSSAVRSRCWCEKVHAAQSRVFWLSIGFAVLLAGGLIAALLLK